MLEVNRSDWPWGNVLNFGDEDNADTHLSIPDVNVRDEENSYEIEIEAPNRDKKDFDLFIENRLLTVAAAKQADSKHGDGKSDHSSFTRTFNVPTNTNEEKIQAKYTDGVLRISMPKTSRADIRSKRSIEIS